MKASRNLTTLGVVLAFDGGSRVAAQLCMVLTVRLLGPGQFGQFTVALTLFGLITLFADAGLGDSALQRLTTRPDPATAFQTGPARRRVQTGLLATGATLIATTAAAASGHLAWGTAILCLAVPAWILTTNRALELRAMERFRQSAAVTSSLNFALTASPLAGAFLIPNSIAAAAATSAGLWLLAARRLRRVTRPSDAEGLRDSLALGLPFLLTGLAVALYSRGDRLVLALLGDTTATGLYSAAYTVALAASLLGNAIQVMALPRALREHAVSGATWIAVRRRLLIAWGPSIAVVAVTVWYAEPIVRLLYGTAFAASAPLLIALSPLIPLYVMNPYLGTLLVAAGRETVVTRIAFANLALASILFPVAVLTGGALYLAVASVIVEASGHGLTLIAVKRLLGSRAE